MASSSIRFHVSETLSFNGVGTFTLSYDYNLADELKKITDASNSTINYGYDSIGRLNGVTGSDNLVGGVAEYASSFHYRAWGALKTMTDGSSHTSTLLYNSRLQPTYFDLSGGVVAQNYDYYNDGRVSLVHNTTDVNFDRLYSYDHAGRLIEAKSGSQVNGIPNVGVPYYETFGYDAFSNLTARQSDQWNGYFSDSDSATYASNRRGGWGYDADGRNTTIDTRTYTFDAAGQTTLMTGQRWLVNHYVNTSQASSFSGDGAKEKEALDGVTTYYLRSSVLGGAIIEELASNGAKNVGYVYSPGGQLLAQQANNEVSWKHSTPAGTGNYEIAANGTVTRVEFDPLGADVGLNAPATPDTGGGEGDLGSNHVGGIMSQRWSNFFNLSAGCAIDGLAASCSSAMGAVNAGAGVIGPANTTRWNPDLNSGQGGHEFFHAFADGTQAWGPLSGIPGVTASNPRPTTPPSLKPYNDPRHPYRATDPNLETPIRQSPVPLLSDANNLKLYLAFGDAGTAIAPWKRGRNPCFEFFTQGRSLAEVSKILSNFWKSATYDPRLADPASTKNSNQGMAASVRVGTVFFSERGPMYDWSQVNNMYLETITNLTPRQYRALIILHEFAHALGLIPKDGPKSDPTGQQSLQNTQTLFEECRRQLESLPLN